MTALEQAEIQLQNAEKKLRQKQARLDDLKARRAKQKRKNDTRRKILLGAALQAVAKKGPQGQKIIDYLIRTMDEKDRKLFQNGSD